VHETPDRSVINLETALGKFDHQPAQGEVLLLRPFQQPGTMLPAIAFGLCPPICPDATLPVCRKRRTQNGRVDAHAELRRGPVAGHAAPLNRCDYPLAKIDRIRFAHSQHVESEPSRFENLEGSVRSRSREGAADAYDATSLKPD